MKSIRLLHTSLLGLLGGVLGWTLLLSGFNIFDALSTMVIQDRMVNILGWYDNEWGYSCRTVEMCSLIAQKGF